MARLPRPPGLPPPNNPNFPQLNKSLISKTPLSHQHDDLTEQQQLELPPGIPLVLPQLALDLGVDPLLLLLLLREAARHHCGCHPHRGGRSQAYPKPHRNRPPPFPAKPRSQEASAGSACRACRDHHTGSVQGITQGLRLRSHTSCIRGSMSWWTSGRESLNKMEEEQRRVCAGEGSVVRRRSRPAST